MYCRALGQKSPEPPPNVLRSPMLNKKGGPIYGSSTSNMFDELEAGTLTCLPHQTHPIMPLPTLLCRAVVPIHWASARLPWANLLHQTRQKCAPLEPVGVFLPLVCKFARKEFAHLLSWPKKPTISLASISSSTDLIFCLPIGLIAL